MRRESWGKRQRKLCFNRRMIACLYSLVEDILDRPDQGQVILDQLRQTVKVVVGLAPLQLLHPLTDLGQLGQSPRQARVLFAVAQHGCALGKCTRALWQLCTSSMHNEPPGSLNDLQMGFNVFRFEFFQIQASFLFSFELKIRNPIYNRTVN